MKKFVGDVVFQDCKLSRAGSFVRELKVPRGYRRKENSIDLNSYNRVGFLSDAGFLPYCHPDYSFQLTPGETKRILGKYSTQKIMVEFLFFEISETEPALREAYRSPLELAFTIDMQYFGKLKRLAEIKALDPRSKIPDRLLVARGFAEETLNTKSHVEEILKELGKLKNEPESE